MNVDGSNQTQLTKAEGGYPRFVSNNGQWVYYESGLHQTLWRVATGGGEELQISKGRSWEPTFSSNGALVACLELGEHEQKPRIALMSVESGEIESFIDIPGDQEEPVKIAWSPTRP